MRTVNVFLYCYKSLLFIFFLSHLRFVRTCFTLHFDTYLCTPRTHKDFKGTRVNWTLPSLCGKSLTVFQNLWKRWKNRKKMIGYQMNRNGLTGNQRSSGFYFKAERTLYYKRIFLSKCHFGSITIVKAFFKNFLFLLVINNNYEGR